MNIKAIPLRGDIIFRPNGEGMLLLDYDSRRDGRDARAEFLKEMIILSVGGQTYVLEDIVLPDHVRMQLPSKLLIAEADCDAKPVLIYSAEVV